MSKAPRLKDMFQMRRDILAGRSVKEVAEHFKVSQTTVRRYCISELEQVKDGTADIRNHLEFQHLLQLSHA
jgi:DeoR/GlpR family transcriptional regulator of sugar metabolism